MKPRVVVVGGGVVGLSTAVCIQDALPEARVTVVAHRFSPDTTSDGAAGIFVPTAERIYGIPEDTIRRWSEASFFHYDRLAYSVNAGAFVISGYELYDAETSKPRPVFADIVYEYRSCTEQELNSFPKKFKCGYFVTTLLIECRRYLPWLLQRFKSKEGIVEQRKVETLEEFVGQYDVVVNCSGLGSRDLVRDTVIVPMRGQTMRVHAPWIKLFYRDVNNLSSVLPCYDTVLLGGTRQLNDYDEGVNAEDANHIWKLACELVSSVKESKVLYEWTGLRPWRGPLRLEKETMHFNKGDLKVVHNYGHGSNGVSLSWGTAMEAAQLVKTIQNSTPNANL